MNYETQEQLNEATYTALGRVVVKFSHLLHALETCTARFIIGLDGQKLILLEAVMADRTAAPIVSAFFSVFFKHWGNEISDEDSRILRAIRSELEAVVKDRNRIMHDAWMGKTVGGESGPHALSRLRTRAHGRGIDFESVDMPPDVLNEFGSNIERLAKLIFAIVFYARPGQIGPGVHQRFEIVDGKVLEKASE